MRLTWLLMPLLLLSGAAGAQGVVVDKGDVRFISKQLGVNVEGRFRRWKANVLFLPKDLGKSKIDVDVDITSIDLASEDSEKELKDRLWFDTARFPVAHFASTSFKDLGSDKYEMAGQLSLKGVSGALTVPFAVTKDAAGNSVAEGQFTLKRLEFKVGEGAWADTDTVANDVLVRVRMVLPPGK